MADTKIVNVSGVCRPSARLKRRALMLYGGKMAAAIDSMVEDSVAIDGLARLLDQAMNASVSKDGRLDLREMALFMIREMRRNQR